MNHRDVNRWVELTESYGPVTKGSKGYISEMTSEGPVVCFPKGHGVPSINAIKPVKHHSLEDAVSIVHDHSLHLTSDENTHDLRFDFKISKYSIPKFIEDNIWLIDEQEAVKKKAWEHVYHLMSDSISGLARICPHLQSWDIKYETSEKSYIMLQFAPEPTDLDYDMNQLLLELENDYFPEDEPEEYQDFVMPTITSCALWIEYIDLALIQAADRIKEKLKDINNWGPEVKEIQKRKGAILSDEH